jgi:peptide/nickel transport system permease protein
VYIVFVLVIISMVMFTIYSFVPGDRALLKLEGPGGMTAEQWEYTLARTRAEMRLDEPLYIQYFAWMGDVLSGDFGYSTQYRQSVARVIPAPMRNTVQLNIIGLILVFGITIPLGIYTAVRKDRIFDKVVQVVSIIGLSMPSFIWGLLFISFFAVRLGWFPISGSGTIGFSGNWFEGMLDRMRFMAMPLMVYVFTSLAGITRYVRGAMIEALRMDYIRTARAKGLREKVVIYSHAFRNSLIIVVTIMTTSLVGIFGGSVMIERIFLWNGMGNVMIEALFQRDWAVAFAISLFYALLALLANLLMDILYGIVDPRVKITS